MADKVIVGIDDLTALADAARDNLGETQLYSLNELTDAVSRASALPQDGIEGQVVVMGPDGKPIWDVVPQGDWAENDETSPAYIKNRTHYEVYEKQEIMPATAADMVSPEEAMAIYINPVELDVDKEYTITYNGVEYKSKCVSGEELMGQPDVLILGNYGLMTGGTDTGEPFAIMTIPAEFVAQSGFAMAVYMLDGATELTLSITYEGNVIHKLDDKYINFKKPNWDAKNGEEGYIANRTHYKERYGEYELNLSNVDGLDCFEVESGVMAYKVSEDILPYPAKEQAVLMFYTSDNVGYQLTATDARADDGYVYAKGDKGGFYSISQVAWASSDLGLNIPSTGTYIFIKNSKVVRAVLRANEIVFKLDNRYLDLSNYYTKWETNQKLTPYPTNLGNRSLKDISDTGKLDISGYKDIQVDLLLQGKSIADTIKVKMYDSNNAYICDMVIAENLGISDTISIQAYYRASGLLNIDVEVGNSAILRDMKRFVWKKATSVRTLGTIQIYTVNGTVFGDNAVLTMTGVKV